MGHEIKPQPALDESYRRAVDAGATSHSEPADIPWGERLVRVSDPDGLTINLGAPAPA
ncbi:VOC family protein [Ruania suaedae]|uniref:VOC family protein n=1 Tax=Ruania suaedae TaxID=2897774 RepID=UPI00338DC1EF